MLLLLLLLLLLSPLGHVLFELQKNEPKSLKNLSRAQNRTHPSSVPLPSLAVRAMRSRERLDSRAGPAR
jgi:hypothetical protein